jgi:hypothetical protein
MKISETQIHDYSRYSRKTRGVFMWHGRYHARGIFAGWFSKFKITFLFIVALSTTSGHFGYSISYFSDEEKSHSNQFSATSLDFVVTPENLVEVRVGPEDGGSVLVSPIIASDTASSMEYRVHAEEMAGSHTLCASVHTSIVSPVTFNGSLLSLSLGPTSAVGQWPLTFSIPSDPSVSHGDTCYVDLVYRGWKIGASEGEGYSDEERVHLKFVARKIVLNEFLPNPGGIAYGFDFGDDSSAMPKGEWVELYNNSSSPVNLNGWYVWDGSGSVANKIPITVANTNTGTTVIPAGEWLVVYMNKAVLNNGGDTVKLYDPSDSLIDSYAYANHDVCSYEPTPGDSNALSGSGSTCDSVPSNKSYARIPDGLGAWIDPIPTPGFSNNQISEVSTYPEVIATSTEVSAVVVSEEVVGEIATTSEPEFPITPEPAVIVPEEIHEETVDETIVSSELEALSPEHIEFAPTVVSEELSAPLDEPSEVIPVVETTTVQ